MWVLRQVGNAAGLESLAGNSRTGPYGATTSAKAKMEQTWEARCSLSCPSVHGTRAEGSMPKERVPSFLL